MDTKGNKATPAPCCAYCPPLLVLTVNRRTCSYWMLSINWVKDNGQQLLQELNLEVEMNAENGRSGSCPLCLALTDPAQMGARIIPAPKRGPLGTRRR